jgi:hypothetical protein
MPGVWGAWPRECAGPEAASVRRPCAGNGCSDGWCGCCASGASGWWPHRSVSTGPHWRVFPRGPSASKGFRFPRSTSACGGVARARCGAHAPRPWAPRDAGGCTGVSGAGVGRARCGGPGPAPRSGGRGFAPAGPVVSSGLGACEARLDVEAAPGQGRSVCRGGGRGAPGSDEARAPALGPDALSGAVSCPVCRGLLAIGRLMP